jgi:hypothetical protein
MKKLLWFVGGVVVLGIVGRFLEPDTTSSSSGSNIPTTQGINKAHDQMARASRSQRNAVMTKTLVSEECGAVTSTFFRGIVKSDNSSVWVATCDNDKKYQVLINADERGTMKILDCDVASAVGVDCSKEF